MFRSGLVVLVAFVVTGAGLLAGPERVWAAEVWSREVRFEQGPHAPGSQGFWFSTGVYPDDYYGSGCVGGYAETNDYTDYVEGVNPWNVTRGQRLPGTGLGPPWGAANGLSGACWNGGGVYEWAFSNGADDAPLVPGSWPTVAEDGGTVSVSGLFSGDNQGSGGDVSICWWPTDQAVDRTCEVLFAVPGYGSWPNPVATAFDVEVEVPDGTLGVTVFVAGSVITYQATVVRWLDGGVASSSSCAGFGALAEGQAGVVGVAGPGHVWGDFALGGVYVPGACVSSNLHIVEYSPSEGIDPSGQYHVGVQAVASTPLAAARVQSFFVGGGQAVQVQDYTQTATGGFCYGIVRYSAPAWATAVRFVIWPGTALQGVLVSAYDTPTGELPGQLPGGDTECEGSNGLPGSGGGSGSFGNCSVPEEWTDLGGWFSYVGCILLGIPGAVAGYFVGILTQLFVPTSIGSEWAAFYDDLRTHVPFVYVSGAAAFLAGMLTQGNLAGDDLPLDFTLLGADVALNFASVAGPLSGYRWIWAGLVYIGVGFTLYRMAGRALGYDPPIVEGWQRMYRGDDV